MGDIKKIIFRVWFGSIEIKRFGFWSASIENIK